MNSPQIFQQSHSKVFSSINRVPIVDKEVMKRMDNIKLQILERDNKKIKSYEIPLLNIKKCDKKNLFERQKQLAKNLVLQKAMKNFKNVRDSIPLAKERKLKSILRIFNKLKPMKKKSTKKKKKEKKEKKKKKKEEKKKKNCQEKKEEERREKEKEKTHKKEEERRKKEIIKKKRVQEKNKK